MKKLILSIALLPSLPALLQAQIQDNFSSYTVGNDLSTPLNGGTGWNGDWTRIDGGNGDLNATVENTSPLNTGGNYLTFTGTGSTTHTLYRTMNTSAVDFSATHQIRFDFRVDDFSNAGSGGLFSTTSDRFEFYSANLAFPGGFDNIDGSSSSSFLFGIFGANRGDSTAGNFAVYNPDTVGSNVFDEGFYVNLGVGTGNSGGALTAVEGTTYSVTIDLFPVTQTWNLSITDGTNTSTSNGLNFWGDDTTQERLAFNTRGNNSADTRIASIDSIAVIPEPGTLALVGVALGALLVFRRRR